MFTENTLDIILDITLEYIFMKLSLQLFIQIIPVFIIHIVEHTTMGLQEKKLMLALRPTWILSAILLPVVLMTVISYID